MELFVRKNTTKIKISTSQRISIRNCMNFDHNKMFRLFNFQSGYRKLYLNNPKGYNKKIINVQTGNTVCKWYALQEIWQRAKTSYQHCRPESRKLKTPLLTWKTRTLHFRKRWNLAQEFQSFILLIILFRLWWVQIAKVLIFKCNTWALFF